jgi:hypothetical protein
MPATAFLKHILGIAKLANPTSQLKTYQKAAFRSRL